MFFFGFNSEVVLFTSKGVFLFDSLLGGYSVDVTMGVVLKIRRVNLDSFRRLVLLKDSLLFQVIESDFSVLRSFNLVDREEVITHDGKLGFGVLGLISLFVDLSESVGKTEAAIGFVLPTFTQGKFGCMAHLMSVGLSQLDWNLGEASLGNQVERLNLRYITGSATIQSGKLQKVTTNSCYMAVNWWFVDQGCPLNPLMIGLLFTCWEYSYLIMLSREGTFIGPFGNLVKDCVVSKCCALELEETCLKGKRNSLKNLVCQNEWSKKMKRVHIGSDAGVFNANGFVEIVIGLSAQVFSKVLGSTSILSGSWVILKGVFSERYDFGVLCGLLIKSGKDNSGVIEVICCCLCIWFALWFGELTDVQGFVDLVLAVLRNAAKDKSGGYECSSREMGLRLADTMLRGYGNRLVMLTALAQIQVTRPKTAAMGMLVENRVWVTAVQRLQQVYGCQPGIVGLTNVIVEIYLACGNTDYRMCSFHPMDECRVRLAAFAPQQVVVQVYDVRWLNESATEFTTMLVCVKVWFCFGNSVWSFTGLARHAPLQMENFKRYVTALVKALA